MLAHLHGQLWNASNIAKSFGIPAPTVGHYLDILEDTFIVRRLQPYHFNTKKRLIKSSKVYVRDSGLLHALLKTRIFEDLYGHPSMGSSWEGFVIEQILGLIPQSWTTYFYRTNAGAEVDLLLFDGRNRPVAIEIKYSSSPKVERGYRNALEDLSCKKGFVVYPGAEAYPLGRNVFTLPLKNIEKFLD
jgi:predicted AAA+ superfamily ATPase